MECKNKRSNRTTFRGRHDAIIKFEVIEINEVNVRNSSVLSFTFTCLCITKLLLIRITNEFENIILLYTE